MINRHGKKIPEKLVIIESDDWGAIRTPSREALQAFAKKGMDVARSVYKVDSLASKEDLEKLFDVLSSFTGADRRPAKLTANVIMANPDFDKIRASDYREYHYEHFADTFKKYPEHQKNLGLWKKGMEEGVFRPQYHGREHLNYRRWLRALLSGNEDVRFCFNWHTTFSGKEDYSFMEAFDWDTRDDIAEQKEVVKEGLRLFRQTFGYASKSFIAPCYNWDPDLETTLYENDVRWVQGIRSQMAPTGSFGSYSPIRHTYGEVAASGLRYNIRNCYLEPSMNPEKDWVSSCLAQIASAFLFHKPAVICSHRINYVGFIDPDNRERGLKDLRELLKTVVKRWPDARFISTDELTD